MATTIASLLDKLKQDPWRVGVGFSSDIERANTEMWRPNLSDYDIASILKRWLATQQPCLFGRIAAGASDLLSYCILTERDLQGNETDIKAKIQRYRLNWWRKAYRGEKSGFVILACSPTLAKAEPGPVLCGIATRLCMLYLIDEIKMDTVHLDHIRLQDDGFDWIWDVGVNFFGAQGDKRWWHDHRVPGGIAFSMNSVGHFVKSAMKHKAAEAIAAQLSKASGIKRHGIDSLKLALQFAMLTIANAKQTEDGRATWLDDDKQEGVSMFPDVTKLKSKKASGYKGFYHTDFTLPQLYFSPAVRRPANVKSIDLDFTYLFDNSIDNPAFERMGSGMRIDKHE